MNLSTYKPMNLLVRQGDSLLTFRMTVLFLLDIGRGQGSVPVRAICKCRDGNRIYPLYRLSTKGAFRASIHTERVII